MAWHEAVIAKVGTLANSGFLSYILWTSFVLMLSIVFIQKKKKWDMLNKIPGPKTLPFIGNVVDLYAEPKELFKVMTDKFCDPNFSLSRVWIGWIPFLFIYKATSIEVILSSQKHIQKSSDYDLLHQWLGTGLLTSSGKKWHSRRKMLTPAFHFTILEDFVDVFNKQSSILVNKLAVEADSGNAFDIFKYITLCTLDIILETAMGRRINAQDNSDSDYVKAIYKMNEIVQRRQVRPWLRFTWIFNLTKMKKEQDDAIRLLHDLSNSTIKEKRKHFQSSTNSKTDSGEGKRKKLAFLDLLLNYSENGNALSDQDIREEVDTFLFAGHDTTSAAINWAVYLFGSHPEIQDKVYKEIHSVLGDSDRRITSKDITEMKYFGCCMKEALRLYPSVPMFVREILEDVMIDGYKVPSGTTILAVIYKLHRDPAQFPDPEKFKPERFLPENYIGKHPYAYVPFSAGPRNCIGQKFALMEDKIVLVNLLRNYRIESSVEKDNLNIIGELILRPKDGNFVKLFKRK